jgi:predicted nicotinamide N-methyase
MAVLRVRYYTMEFGDIDIHVRTLRDNQQFNDDDGIAEALGITSALWPLFGIIWPSGEVLAHFMQSFDIVEKRILEVGCGIALASLLLNHRLADITATDYHPEAENFLNKNTQLNNSKTIPFIRTNWSEKNNTLGKFDVIIGSDLLYERGHATLLCDFIEQHANQHCEVIITDPGRGNQGNFNRNMALLGYSEHHTKVINVDYLALPYNGTILRYTR